MTANPLAEIRRVERMVSQEIAAASTESTAAVAEAKRAAAQLVRDARDRGRAAAERRYQDGLQRARDEAEAILADADGRVAALRRQAETALPGAVDEVMRRVVPGEG